ncbi:MAG: hypothetical protein AB1728_15790, partial [Bacteroidota bacterium]
FLIGSIRSVGQTEVQYSHSDVNDISKTSVSIFSPPQIFFIDIVNTFDETIQDQPEVSGTMELICDAVPSANATIKLSQFNISTFQYNPLTKLLTLDPEDTLRLRVAWHYKTDDGKWGFQKADVENETVDGSGRFMTRVHKPITYTVTAKVKLFKQVGALTAKKTQISLVYSGRITFPP